MSTFNGPLDVKGAIRHVAIADGTGTKTITTIVDADGVLIAAPITTEPLAYSNATTISAGATQTQAGATALTEEFNNVTTSATDGDGVKLPTAVAGLSIKVKNSGAASLAVWPATGDSINALAVNLSVNIPPGGIVTFTAIDGTTWETQEVFVSHAPTTQKGEFVFKAVDNDGDTVTTLSNAAMGQASVISIPDPGAATANVVLTSAANDQSLVTATNAEINKLDDSAAVMTKGSGVAAAETYASGVFLNGTLKITRIVVDLTTEVSGAADLDIIGDTGGAANAHFGQVTAALNGTIVGGSVTCLEAPVGGATDIDFYSATVGTGAQDADVTTLEETVLITAGGAWTSGAVKGMTTVPPANDYLYIVNGAASAGAFTAGKFLIELYGV